MSINQLHVERQSCQNRIAERLTLAGLLLCALQSLIGLFYGAIKSVDLSQQLTMNVA